MSDPKRDAYLASRRAAYQRRREANLEYAAKYREEHRDELRQKDAAVRARRKPYFQSYSVKNADRIRERRAKWTEANRDRIASLNAKWLQNNLDKHRTHQHNRRAKKAAGGKLSSDLVPRLLKLQRGRCACCRESLALGFELDHIVPLAIGGENVDANIQLLTPLCNRKKGALAPADYMQRRGLLL
jgi:5-methylcytosine-specific restriction endonuclease McrA